MSIFMLFPLELVLLVHGSKQCYQDYECAFDKNLTIPQTSNVSEKLDCFGYYSCVDSTIVVSDSNSSDVSINCDGAYSCYNTTVITNDDSEINCNGLFSCAFSTQFCSSNKSINCNIKGFGEYSLYSSSLYLGYYDEYSNNYNYTTSIGANLSVQGHQSVSNSIIYNYGNGGLFKFNGHAEAINTTIYNFNGNSTFIFEGTSSTLNTTIYCGVGFTCDIVCSGDSCNGLTVLCNNETEKDKFEKDVECIINVDCITYGAEESNLCPNGIKLSNVSYKIPNLINLTTSTFENSVELCNLNSSINCDDYDSNYDARGISTCKNTRLINNNGTICCTGSESCQYSQKMVSYISNNKISDSIPVSIRCDGKQSCINVRSNGSITVPNGGDIYITGYFGVGYDNSTTDLDKENLNLRSRMLISTTKEFNVVCCGSFSCSLTSFQSINNLFCIAFGACVKSKLIEDINNVWMYGNEAGFAITLIKNISQNVYCNGKQSCSHTSITTIGGDVYGTGYQALKSTVISNVDGNVIGFGFESLAQSTVTNVSSVTRTLRCESYKSCLNSTIKNVDSIVSYGNSSLSGSKIIIDSSSKLKIDIFESNIDFGFDVYCQNSSKCEISCRSRDACSLLNIYCYSNARCSICCHETQFNCPKTTSDKNASIIFDSNCYIYGYAPTSIPSDIPIDTPTQHPSFVPLFLPSSAPSKTASDYINVQTDTYNTTFTQTIGKTSTKNMSNEIQGGNGDNDNNNNTKNAPHWLLYTVFGLGALAVVFAWCYIVEKRKYQHLRKRANTDSSISNNLKSNNQNKSHVPESPQLGSPTASGDSGDEQSAPSSEMSSIEMASFKTKTITITNPLVVFLGIGVYNLKELRNLNGVKFDYKQLIETFVKKYNYKVLYALSKNKNKNKNNKIKKKMLKNIIHADFDYVYTNSVEIISNVNNYKLEWIREEISSLAWKARKYIVQNKHDGMIFALSCHGNENGIIYASTAEDPRYYLENLYLKFKSRTPAEYPEKEGESKHLCKIPKIFIVDSCRGSSKENVSNINPPGNESVSVHVDEKTHDNYNNDNLDVDRDERKDGRQVHIIPRNDNSDDDDDEKDTSRKITDSQAEDLESDEANFCYIFPTTEGHAAAERKNEGGYLIQSVCKVFNNTDFVIGKTLARIIKHIRKQTKKDATVYKKGREKANGKKFKRKKNHTQTVEYQETLEDNVTFNKNE